ncbi:MAG TPA: hypothetical protein VI643_00055 [Planctomycetota bacterium]|nr:hypothetical protein [Planctomycetota bacterium]
MILVYVEPIPDLNDLSISRSQGRVFERGKRVAGRQSVQAISAAVQLKGRLGEEAAGVIIGADDDSGVARRALAMGLDRVHLFIHPNARDFDGLVKARVASRIIRRTNAEIVLFEAGLAEISFRVSETTGFPVETFPSGFEVGTKPVIFRVAESTAQPRIPSAIDIVRAAKKEIARHSTESLSLTDEDLLPRRVVRATYLVES